jgi:hypothetical protein
MRADRRYWFVPILPVTQGDAGSGGWDKGST